MNPVVVLATTTESGADGPNRPGAINGGFFPKKPDWPARDPSTVLGEPMEILGVGHYLSFTDTEGNRVSMLQPRRRGRA